MIGTGNYRQETEGPDDTELVSGNLEANDLEEEVEPVAFRLAYSELAWGETLVASGQSGTYGIPVFLSYDGT
ncbi:hypothetical protein WG66_005603 [Moniliophthora roreri]|nr:hypothetical protein WG66_005603 [Moniliophthora roreri]